MRRSLSLALLLFVLVLPVHAQRISGELRLWHPVAITFDGPASSETGSPNPFLDYRMDVTFTHAKSGSSYTVPGYFAADGKAGESGAVAGNQWRVHFLPRETGEWRYRVSFRTGPNVAISSEGTPGTPGLLDGKTGTFTIKNTDKKAPDFRARGLLAYNGARYLRFDDGTWFVKGGADSPENFLAYVDFDGTASLKTAGLSRSGEANTANLKTYQPHLKDWKQGDPTWRGGKGKGMIGALNYLASKGMNSIYFLTMNVEGDGQDVWPWTDAKAFDRFDVSKLDQWEIVFNHMDRLGLALHVVLTETENESLFEVEDSRKPDFADARKLYYREIVARFGHHPALVWNIGEENGWNGEGQNPQPAHRANTDEQRKAFSEYIHALDAYDHPVVVHTLPGRYDQIYTPLLGWQHLEGPSLQMGDMTKVHAETVKWVQRSKEAGRQWFVALDEIGPADTGVMPDGPETNQDAVRHHALWGNLMAGGAGVEWYFGYKYPENDLNAQDWHSRDRMWDYTRHALTFFSKYLPYHEMEPADALTTASGAYVLAKPGQVYAVYLPKGGAADLKLSDGAYTVTWYNPRSGGALLSGSVKQVSGPGTVSLGLPPADADQDWVALLRKR